MLKINILQLKRKDKTMKIDPVEWLAVANMRAPKLRGRTPWFSGTTHPSKRGWYERHFTDSMCSGPFLHYWSGKEWRMATTTGRHWRQVGDYPCWRGLTFHAFLKPSRYPGLVEMLTNQRAP